MPIRESMSKAQAKYYEKNKEKIKEKTKEKYEKKKQELLERKKVDHDYCRLLKEQSRLKNETHKHKIIKTSIEELLDSPLIDQMKKEALWTLILTDTYKTLTPKNIKKMVEL